MFANAAHIIEATISAEANIDKLHPVTSATSTTTNQAIKGSSDVAAFRLSAPVVSATDSHINSANQVFLWMDNYCKTNPLKTVGDGGWVLFKELRKK
jgi:hypothetical protein